ncbi:MAG: DUF1579 family protein [Planctomycetota bacterium]|nr:DUF1579 family protein [Planctomycetota bacterium]
MNLWRFAVVAFVASMALRAYAQPANNDFKQTKEWKALNRYVGTWDNQETVTVPELKQSRRTPTAAWILGERFLQLKEKSEDGAEMVHLFAYDQNRRAMRWWSFSSLGNAGVATGSWDEATRTFSFKMEDTGPTSVTLTDRFIDDDHREWRFIVKDADGKVVFDVSGKVTRQTNAVPRPAAVQQSQNNVKQLFIGVMMYANDHRGALPDTIEQLIGTYLKDDKVLRNPRQPDREKGYVWAKPAQKINQVRAPNQVIVLYEAYDKWPGGGLVVGFMDGHVETVRDEEAFKQKLPKPAP